MAQTSPSPLAFLQNLKPIVQTVAQASAGEFFFRLREVHGRFLLDTVDDRRNPVTVDPSAVENGPAAMLLRQMAQVSERVDIAAGWGTQIAGATKDSGVDVQLNPGLLFHLALCTNIVNSKGRPISVYPATTRLSLSLTSDQADRLVPSLQLKVADADGAQQAVTDFAILSDAYVLAQGTLYPVKPLGDNASQINVFLHPFPARILDAYLSVLFTYLPDIGLDYGNYTVERAETEIAVEPTLVIDKLGSDKALYLRLSQGVPGRLADMVQNLGVTVAASLTNDDKVVLRPIRQFNMASKSAELLAEITSYSPNKAAARDVYHDGAGSYIVPEATAAPFLFQGLPSLLSRYNVIGTDKLRAYNVSAVFPKVNLRLSSGIDFLEGEATVDLGNQTITLAELLDQYSRNRYVKLADGTHGVIDPAYMRRLERIFKPGTKKGAAIKVSFFDLPEVAELLGKRVTDSEAFARPRKFYEGFNSIASGRMSFSNINAELRPYQTYGVKWLKYLYDNKLGGCLADDMGLGKTLQTIAFIARVQPSATKPTLIVMPRSLLFNWQSEFERFAPQIDVHTYYGPARDLTEALKHQVIFTTYALVRNDIEQLSKQKFHMVVLDESQNIKNLATGVTKSVHILQAERRFALSGTPIENNLLELYSLFSFLNPAMFGTSDDFTRRYASPIQQNDDSEALADLRRRIFPFMLRRVKSEVLSELPDRMDQTVMVDMDTPQAKLYEQRRAFYRERVQQSIATEGLAKSHFVMFQALNELRRIASVPESLTDGRVTSAKLDLLADHILEAAANGHKSVVFFNFIAGIELIGERLEREGVDYTCMTGSTTDRRSVVERFQTDPSCRVLLMTLKTGGVGLNLTAADTVFIVEPWWNKAAEEQAINRLHRFGQTAKVSCYSLITRGTIEEKIRELQQRKADLFDEIITADSTRSKHLTEEDINFILS